MRILSYAEHLAALSGTITLASLLSWLRAIVLGGRRSPFAPDTGPTRLIVMRHAEKTGDKADMGLSDAGEARAERLATYIPQTFGKPDFIVAAMQSKHSNRSYETVVPLSEATGVTIDDRFKDTEAEALVEALGAQPRFRGKFGVISWHHQALPDLIADLGASEGTYPADWDPDVFNLIIEIDYGRDPPAVRQITEPF